MEHLLWALCNYEQDNWVDLLPLVEFPYSNSIHQLTRMTPFWANYNYHSTMQFKQPMAEPPDSRSHVQGNTYARIEIYSRTLNLDSCRWFGSCIRRSCRLHYSYSYMCEILVDICGYWICFIHTRIVCYDFVWAQQPQRPGVTNLSGPDIAVTARPWLWWTDQSEVGVCCPGALYSCLQGTGVFWNWYPVMVVVFVPNTELQISCGGAATEWN